MKVSLVIPIFNEADHLEKFLRAIDVFTLPMEKELVIIDDCSSDNSLEILRQFPFTSQVQVLTQSKNKGKGAALQLGITVATGEVIGIQDADFEYDIEDIPKLLELFLIDKADVVFGSRFKKSCPQVHRTYHYLVNRFLTILSNVVSGLYLTDMETCYKFFRKDIIKNIVIECDRFGFEPEVTAKLACLRCRVMEIPISYYPRNYLEGKKITWKDGFAALWHIINFNLLKSKKTFFRHQMPDRFIPNIFQWL